MIGILFLIKISLQLIGNLLFWSYKKNKRKFIDGYLFRVNNFKNTSLKHFILRIISLLNINLNQNKVYSYISSSK